MADLQTIRQRLEQYIVSGGHTFREVSLKIGRKDSYIQQYIKYGFPKRLNEVDRRKICRLLNIAETELIDDDLRKNGIVDRPLFEIGEEHSQSIDYNIIDIYTLGKNQQDDLHMIGKIAVNPEEFYGWFNGNPDKLKIIRQNGDSMEPTIISGCLVIYDTAQKEYTGEGIYFIKYDGQPIIKRLQKYGSEAYILKSENPRYQDIHCTAEEFEILGRAVNTLTTRLI